jgi:hypothetical protein
MSRTVSAAEKEVKPAGTGGAAGVEETRTETEKGPSPRAAGTAWRSA